MEGHVSAPILGTPAWYAQREVELLARLARQPQAVVQLWLHKVRIQSIANAQSDTRGHVNLLADLLERLLEERERVQRDGLLLLGGLLPASTHHEGVMEAGPALCI